MRKMSALFFLLALTISSFGQRRYSRNPGPGDLIGGGKISLIGGIIWGLGMLLVLSVNSVSGKESSNPIKSLGGWLAVIGGLTFILGLLVMGF